MFSPVSDRREGICPHSPQCIRIVTQCKPNVNENRLKKGKSSKLLPNFEHFLHHVRFRSGAGYLTPVHTSFATVSGRIPKI